MSDGLFLTATLPEKPPQVCGLIGFMPKFFRSISDNTLFPEQKNDLKSEIMAFLCVFSALR